MLKAIIGAGLLALSCKALLVRHLLPRSALAARMCVGTPAPPTQVSELSKLEIRVGKIIEVGLHPEADNLFLEKIDLGESEPRTIISGLVGFQTKEQLLNRAVVVLANLKPRAIKGITSNGMVLCTSNADKTQVDPLSPPPDAKVGELITFAGHASDPAEPGNRATKAYSKVAAGFATNADGIATFESVPFMTKAGPCTSTIVGPIS